MQSFEDTLYSPTGSIMTARSHLNRRFSDASGVLPSEPARSRRDSSSEESSYTFGKPQEQYLSYAPTPGLITPPGSSSRDSSFLDDGRQTVMSYYTDVQIDETDDPAVTRSVFQHSSRHTPSLPSLPSANRSVVDHRSMQSGSPSLGSQGLISPISPLSISPMQRQPSSPQQISLPYTCSFRMSTNGSMVLAPPEASTDLSPLYRVEVYPNVFTPTSFITKIYRGSTVFLAQFECVIWFCLLLRLTNMGWQNGCFERQTFVVHGSAVVSP